MSVLVTSGSLCSSERRLLYPTNKSARPFRKSPCRAICHASTSMERPHPTPMLLPSAAHQFQRMRPERINRSPTRRLAVGTAGGHSDANCARHRVAKRDSSRSSSLTNLRELMSESRRARPRRQQEKQGNSNRLHGLLATIDVDRSFAHRFLSCPVRRGLSRSDETGLARSAGAWPLPGSF